MRVISRDEAIARRMTWFFTGKPCKWGHVEKRNVCNYVCRGCANGGRGKAQDRELVEKRKHQQWLADFRKRRADRLAAQKAKQALEIDHPMLS